MKRAVTPVFALCMLAACGPKPKPAPIPVLPGDGDANVAKPPPLPTTAKADDPWAGKTDLIAPPAAQAPAKVDLPPIDEFKLSNGLQVYVIKSDRMPVMSMQLAIRAGRMDEPRARLGVAEATADMLVKGTKERDAVSIAKAIDFVGGTIAADATFEATLVSCSVLSRNASTCFELVPEMITQPTFPDDELAKIKNLLIGQTRQRLDDAATLASLHVQNLLWGNEHVRGWIDSEASISALRRDDLVAWHKTWFAPNNAMLVIAGDVDPKQIKGQLERAFGGWKKATVPPAPSYPEPGLSGIRIRLVDKPGQTQTHIRVAEFGIKHEDPRFFDTLVWNYALGGGSFSSRLMKVVRVDGGKTYGASSAFDRNLDKGSFVIQTFTRNSEAVATTKLLIAEIAKMAKDGPNQDEVTAAISNIASGYGMRFQSSADIGAALIGAELHGFGKEYLTNYPIAVGQVTTASAKQAAGEILDPNDYVIVMVGDAKDVEPQLKKEGWRYEKVPVTDPITAEVKEKAAPVDAKMLAAVKQQLAIALAAKGGKTKLDSIKGLHLVASGTTSVPGKSVPVEIERTFTVPDKLRVDATLAGQMKVTLALVGAVGWQQATNPQTGKLDVADLDPANSAAVAFERWRDPELILLRATDPAAKLTPRPDETIDGKPQTVIDLGSPYNGLDVSIYIDKASKQITRMSYSDLDPSGHRSSEVDDFADYRDVGGVKVAFKRTTTVGPRVTVLEFSKIEIDPKIDPKVYARPAAAP